MISMTGRAIWKGYIHFRSVDLPVKLHATVKEERIQFHLLHGHDHVKLKQQMVCGDFQPDGDITRAEVCAVLSRMLLRIP